MVEECQPFDEDIVVYKICGRWFATIIFSRPDTIAVKCNPDRAILLRDEYSAITPAWHWNKKHWSDIAYMRFEDKQVQAWISESHACLVNQLPKRLRANYQP